MNTCWCFCLKAGTSVYPVAWDRQRKGWFLPGRLKIDMLVPSSGTFTQDRKPHHAQDYFCPGRPGNQLKCLSSCGAWSLQKRADLQRLQFMLWDSKSTTLNTQSSGFSADSSWVLLLFLCLLGLKYHSGIQKTEHKIWLRSSTVQCNQLAPSPQICQNTDFVIKQENKQNYCLREPNRITTSHNRLSSAGLMLRGLLETFYYQLMHSDSIKGGLTSPV